MKNVLFILPLLIAFQANIVRGSSDNNKICLATIWESQSKIMKAESEYTSSLEKLFKMNSMTKKFCSLGEITVFGKADRFTAIGSFKNDIWVINEKKDLINAKK